MKTFATLKAIVMSVLFSSGTIAFSSFLVEPVYAHSSSGSAGSHNSNDHEHKTIVPIGELLLQVTLFTAGLAIAFTLLFRKKEIIDKLRLNKNSTT
jgi:hypothetical protein